MTSTPSCPILLFMIFGELFAPLFGDPNISDFMRELVIGHTRPGLHKVYDQYAYLDREALCIGCVGRTVADDNRADAWQCSLR